MSYIAIPTFSDPYLHPLHKDNGLSLLYLRKWGDREGRMICINHPDCGESESIDEIKNDHTNLYITPDKKKLTHIFPNTRLIDVNYLSWKDTNLPVDLENIRLNAYDFFHSKYYNVKDLNEIIPFSKHKEYCDKVFDKMVESFVRVYESEYHLDVTEAFSSIEKNGIKVSDDVCDIFDMRVKKHISDGKLYSQYNLWTSTGRPSNSFGSVNFSALTKEQRRAFIPENDILVEYDYDAYHLRLIGDLVEYQFGKDSVHQHLAERYGCSYEDSKQISFRQLYGGIDKEVRENIEFFGLTYDKINTYWEYFNDNKYIETDIYNRKLFMDNYIDMNKNKLFNYLIQAYETESNIKTIIEVQRYLLEKETKLILYGYDSFLFDVSNNDGVKVLKDIKNILERNGHSVKSKAGLNYGDVTDITERLQ
jgi:hypothetical protein|tara:strand:+ start:134 stop:1396 length:1263 start_codon:yes stop_codon:yes gene_type:complete